MVEYRTHVNVKVFHQFLNGGEANRFINEKKKGNKMTAVKLKSHFMLKRVVKTHV